MMRTRAPNGFRICVVTPRESELQLLEVRESLRPKTQNPASVIFIAEAIG
jgi:hypothetical protein